MSTRGGAHMPCQRLAVCALQLSVMASSVADDRDEENMAKGPFIAVAVTSQTDAGEWHVMRTARTGEVATTVSPFRRAVTVPPQRAGDSGLLFSIWHRVSQVGASTTEQGAAESQQLAPELASDSHLACAPP